MMYANVLFFLIFTLYHFLFPVHSKHVVTRPYSSILASPATNELGNVDRIAKKIRRIKKSPIERVFGTKSVIIVYEFTECNTTFSKPLKEFEGVGCLSGICDTREKFEESLRNATLSQLEKRLMSLFKERHALKKKNSFHVKLVPLYIQNENRYHLRPTCTNILEVQTRFLPKLQMEIVMTSNYFTQDDIIMSTKNVQCIVSAEKNRLIHTLFPQKFEHHSITPRNLFHQKERELDRHHTINNENIQDYLDSGFTCSSTTDSDVKNNLRGSGHSSQQHDPLHDYTEYLTNIPQSLYFSKYTKNTNNKFVSSIAESLLSKNTTTQNKMDPLFPFQWHLSKHNPYALHLNRLWEYQNESTPMIVAILDNGCDMQHPDLINRYWINKDEICDDGIDNDYNGYIDDCYGWDWVDNDNDPSALLNENHGTAAAGIIGADSNNSIGIASLCPLCQIMCLRYIEGKTGSVSNQIAALDYAVRMGAQISNNGYGNFGYSYVEYRALQRVSLLGHLFVASAGNNNCDTDSLSDNHVPSGYDVSNIISVGASTLSGRRSFFSNYGKATVDVFAPGTLLLTTKKDRSYAFVSGTSFATPVVSGLIGLVWSFFPQLDGIQVKQALLESCGINPYINGTCVCNGIVNATKFASNCKKIYIDNFLSQPVTIYKSFINQNLFNSIFSNIHALANLNPVMARNQSSTFHDDCRQRRWYKRAVFNWFHFCPPNISSQSFLKTLPETSSGPLSQTKFMTSQHNVLNAILPSNWLFFNKVFSFL